MSSDRGNDDDGGGGDPSRRRFMAGMAGALGATVVGATGVVAARYVVSPVGRRTVTAATGPVDVGAVEALVVGAPPRRLPVIAPTLRDGWAQQAGVALGAAWVRRLPGDKLECLSSVCPHLGCAIGWDAARERFNCPCHDSSFDPAGARITGPSPRDMDPLPIAMVNGRLQVTWLRYRQGTGAREVL